MLLKKICLENFRQYNGKHEIEFSTDKERNVTLVMGDNGTGKTTLSQAFLWCLYGTTPAFLKKESLLSKRVEEEMYDGWNRQVRVSVSMEHDGKGFEIIRMKSFQKIANVVKDVSSGFDFNYSDNEGKHFPQGREKETYINEILPEELSQYFFLSGEKIDNMALEIKSGKSKAFANAVNTLLDLDYYKTAVKHLKNIAKEYNTSSVDGFDDKLAEINRKIENDEHNITTFQTQIAEYNKNIEYDSDKIAELKQKLQNTESSRELELERQKLEEKRKNEVERRSYEISGGISDFAKKATYFFASEAMQVALKTLGEVTDVEDEEIPDKLHADLIDWIEKRGVCVCGQPVQKGDEHFEKLEKWRHIVPPESIGTLVNSVKRSTIDKFRIGKDLYQNLKDRRNRNYQYDDEIADLDEKIEALSEKIANAEDTSGTERELRNAHVERTDLQRKVSDTTQLISNLHSDKKQQEKNREILLQSNEEGRKVLAWKKMTEQLIEGFERNLQKDENAKRNQLTSAVKEAFQKMYGTSFTINIDESYNITTSTDLEKSSGQGMTVIFAFLAGLLSVIKQNQNKQKDSESAELSLESYPLVLDAPFSVLDTQRIASICEVLPKVSEQIIIFIKDTDGNITKKNMEGKIGISYKLVKVDNSDENTAIEEEK